MKKDIYIVTENIQLTPSTWRMKLGGDVSSVTAPGQFVNIRLDGHYLRRPISICDIEYTGAETEGDGIITIIYKVLGHGTEEMTSLEPGAELDILIGLGNGYDLTSAGERPLLIGGGVGIPPLYMAARLLMEGGSEVSGPDNVYHLAGTACEADGSYAEVCSRAGSYNGSYIDRNERDVTVILGFNSADEVYYADEFRRLGCRVVISSADGSCGVRGLVTDAFREIAGENEFTHFFTCGPEPMLRAVYNEIYKEAGISGQMSFEERMGCGFGACMGCSCRTISGYKRICRDGPVLRTEEVIFD